MIDEGKEQTHNVQHDPSVERVGNAIAAFMAQDYAIQITVGPWGGGSHWESTGGMSRITIDPQTLAEEPEDVIIGVYSHEGDHAAVSCPETVQDLWNETGFKVVYGANEDNAANHSGVLRNPGVARYKEAYLRHDLRPGGQLDYKGMREETEETLGYVPRIMQYGPEVIRYYFERQYAHTIPGPEDPEYQIQVDRFLKEIPDMKVRETFERDIANIEAYYHAVPDTKDPILRLQYGNTRSDIIRRSWEICKPLVDDSLRDQEAVHMLADILNESTHGKGTLLIPLDSISEKAREEIRTQLEQHASASETPSGATPPSDSKLAGLVWKDLSEDVRLELSDALAKVLQSAPDAYKKEAESDLQKVEDAANEKFRGKLNDPAFTEGHGEHENLGMQTVQGKDISVPKNEQITLVELRQLFSDKKYAQEYQATANSLNVRRIRSELSRQLDRILHPNATSGLRLSDDGYTLETERAMQSEADARIRDVYLAEGLPQARDYRFTFLVDVTLSMTGEKMQHLYDMVVAITEELSVRRVEFEIIAFSDYLPDNHYVFKSFDEVELTPEIKSRLGYLPHITRGDTPTFEATQIAWDRLANRIHAKPSRHNYIVPLTDGKCTTKTAPEMIDQVRGMEKLNADILVQGLGIGPATDFVNETYAKLPIQTRTRIASVLRISVKDVSNSFANPRSFPMAFSIILEDMIEHPEYFRNALQQRKGPVS